VVWWKWWFQQAVVTVSLYIPTPHIHVITYRLHPIMNTAHVPIVSTAHVPIVPAARVPIVSTASS
jgi:hypothetical protein